MAACDVFVVAHPDVYAQGLQYAQALRQARPELRVKTASATSLKSQMKKADKSGARLTVILAQDEIANEQISIKNMQTGEQAVYANTWLFADNNFSG